MFPLILSFGADPFHCLFTRLFLLSVQLIGSADGSFSACQGERVVIYRKCIGAIPCCFVWKVDKELIVLHLIGKIISCGGKDHCTASFTVKLIGCVAVIFPCAGQRVAAGAAFDKQYNKQDQYKQRSSAKNQPALLSSLPPFPCYISPVILFAGGCTWCRLGCWSGLFVVHRGFSNPRERAAAGLCPSPPILIRLSYWVILRFFYSILLAFLHDILIW